MPTTGSPWAIPFARPIDWQDTLGAIASASGYGSFAELPVNVYGLRPRVPMGCQTRQFSMRLVGPC